MSIEFIDLKTQYQHLKAAIDARIHTVLKHGQYILGPEVAELEHLLAEYAGVKHSIGVSDGTSALQMALMALDIGPGDEVITTPFTFIATAEVITLLGAKPVFVDIDPATWNIDPTCIEAAITPSTRAIIAVSLYGHCADFDAINTIAYQHSLAVIEDGAQSFGANYKGRRSCGLTTLSTTSFFPLIGINGRLDTLQAAILLAKWPSFADEVNARARIGARYIERLQNHVRVPILANNCSSVFAQFTIEVEQRDRVQTALKEAGIPTAIHYPIPLHRQPAFAYLGYHAGAFPHAEAAAQRVLSLPMHGFLDEEVQDTIINQIIKIVE